MPKKKVRISPALRRHVYIKLSDDLREHALAALAGFAHVSGLSRQMRQPFPETPLNRERWRCVAEIVGYEGDPFVGPLPAAQGAEVSRD